MSPIFECDIDLSTGKKLEVAVFKIDTADPDVGIFRCSPADYKVSPETELTEAEEEELFNKLCDAINDRESYFDED